MREPSHKAAARGQGVVEYAGALVIAAILVSTVLSAGPDGMETMFRGVVDPVVAFLTNAAEAIG
jgi:hypothetical protein